MPTDCILYLKLHFSLHLRAYLVANSAIIAEDELLAKVFR